MSRDSHSVDIALEKLRAHGNTMPPVVAIQADVTRYDGETCLLYTSRCV